MPKIFITPTAKTVPFDNSTNGFISTESQSAIEELNNTVIVSASPGFSWGRSGNVNSNTWLQNDTVPSNLAGRTIPLANAQITKIYVSNELPNTFNLEIYEHNGITFTLLATVNVVAQRSAQFSISGINVTQNKELAVKLSSGSAKNIVVGLIIKGSIT